MTESTKYTGPEPPHRTAAPGRAIFWLTPVLLVLANLIPLAGVALWDWEVGQILLFYWSENLLVGAFNVLKMLSFPQVRGVLLAAFFTVHYGGFCAAHGALLLSFFDYPRAPPSAISAALEHLPLLGLMAPAFDTVISNAPPLWLWGFAALGLSHAGSFAINFLWRNERGGTSPERLMTAPYQRILILHVVVVAGGIAVAALGSPLILLLVLIAMKIAIDLAAHLRAHGQAGAASQPA